MALLSVDRIRRILFVLFLFAMAYQVALSLGIIQWLARGADRARSPVALRTGTPSIYGVSAPAASAGVRAGDELVAVEGRPYTGRAVWAVVLRRKNARDRMTFAVRSPDGGMARTVSVPLESAGSLGPWGWPVILTIYVVTQFCALLLGFAVALIRPRDPRRSISRTSSPGNAHQHLTDSDVQTQFPFPNTSDIAAKPGELTRAPQLLN